MAQQLVRAKVNPALLVWARVTMGLDVPDVARTVGVKPERLMSWEQGDDQPTINQLEAFARKVRRPLAAFFLPAPPKEPRPPRDFRRVPSADLSKFSPKALLAFRDARNTLKGAEALFAELEFAPSHELPHASLRDDTATAARNLRNILGVSTQEQMEWESDYAALRAWRDMLVDFGVIVLQYSLEPEDVRGFSMTGDVLSAVGVSSKDAPVARVFSLFHEFYHLALRRPGVSGPGSWEPEHLGGPRRLIEQLCNSFAADFLMPLDDMTLRAMLASAASVLPDDREVRRLASRLKVSKYALLRRLLEADLIVRSTYEELERKWHETDAPRRSGGFSKPDTKSISKSGTRFSRLVVEGLDTGRISERDACSLLSVSPKWLGDVRGRLIAGGADE